MFAELVQSRLIRLPPQTELNTASQRRLQYITRQVFSSREVSKDARANVYDVYVDRYLTLKNSMKITE